ncbi:MAG: type II CAAX endopeptidase family protein [Actinomycetaceae bacterium]|nr:type II CAAX endopeptidase family protein [Actinomycetaceae bacterium]
MFFLPHALPSQPAEYHKLGSGTDKRWWRVLLGFLALVVASLILMTLVTLVPFLLDPMGALKSFDAISSGQVDLNDLFFFSVLMLSLIVLIPVAFLATILGLRIRPGYLLSVADKMRWGWLAQCVLLASVVFVPFMLLSTFVLEESTINPVNNLGLALVLVVVLVPLQSAAEELVFRGYLAQTVGALIPGRVVSLVVATVASTLLFAAAHGSFHLTTFAALGAMAFFSMLLTWYTGGLEGAIAIHAVNNTTIFVMAALTGPLDALVTEGTDVGPAAFLVAMALDGGSAALIAWSAKRRGLVRHHDPKRNPQPNLAYLVKEYGRGRVYPQHRELYPPQWQAALWGSAIRAEENIESQARSNEF